MSRLPRIRIRVQVPAKQTWWRRLLWRETCGSALVEFAVCSTILLSLTFGILTSCLALYSYHFIADAAREGTRYAIVRGANCSTNGNFTSDCPVASSAAVQTYVKSLALPGVPSRYMTATTTWSLDGKTWSSTPATFNAPGDLVRVTVNYNLPLAIPFVSTRTLSMSSTSQMIIAD
jgi:Flp pilus assembly protein TadG